MPAYTPSPAFQDAAAYLSSVSSLSKVSTSIKLELYGLFKFLTSSPSPHASRPSIFDMAGRAKWDAWSRVQETYGEGGRVEERYLDIARSLGWVEGALLPRRVSTESHGADANIWDDKSTAPRDDGSRMGKSVSVMVPPSEAPDTSTIHDLSVSNDAEGLSLFLLAHPETDVNERDQFGYTPLHLACDRGSLAVVRVLLSKGADRSLKDQDEFTASELARVAGHDEIGRLLE